MNHRLPSRVYEMQPEVTEDILINFDLQNQIDYNTYNELKKLSE